MPRTLLAWSLGLPLTALAASLSLVGSLADPTGRWAHACMVAWSRLSLRLAGTRIRVSGLEHIEPGRPQVFVANHQSLADILVLAAVLPVRFGFVAKSELFRIPFLGWHMRRAGFIPIDRAHPRQAARTLLEAAERIQRGTCALVFPEGTRSPDGQLLAFRGGAFLLAIRAGVPLVPIAIRGTREIVLKGSRCIRSAEASVAILPPIDPRPFGEDREALAEAVRAVLVRELAVEAG